MKSIKGLVLIALSIVIFGCNNPTIELVDTGTLKIRSYSASYSDPNTITLDNPINAILDVEYPNGVLKTIVTDGLGYYDFGSIKTGTYKITPRYIKNATTTEIYVGKNDNINRTILTPNIEISYYIINGNISPFTNILRREVLCKAIKRLDLITTVNITAIALNGLIPANFNEDLFTNALTINESLTTSQTLLDNDSLSVILTYNNNVSINENIATTVKNQWEAINENVNVALDGLPWAEFIVKRDVNKTFEVARDGWNYDSNNPLSLFKNLGSIDAEEYDNLLQQTEEYLSNGQFGEFELGIISLNNYLLNHYLIIPLYQND